MKKGGDRQRRAHKKEGVENKVTRVKRKETPRKSGSKYNGREK